MPFTPGAHAYNFLVVPTMYSWCYMQNIMRYANFSLFLPVTTTVLVGIVFHTLSSSQVLVSSYPSSTNLSQMILIQVIICFIGNQMIVDRFVDSKELNVHRDEDYFNVNTHLDAKEVHVKFTFRQILPTTCTWLAHIINIFLATLCALQLL